MKTFIEYLQEGSVLAPLALAGSIMAGGVQAPPVAAPTQAVAPVIDPYAHFGGAHNVKLYQALVAGEHRGTDIGNGLDYDPAQYIRTRDKSGKSTAYGPAQITKSTAAGFLKTQPDLFKGQEDYVKQYVAQGQSMLGNVKEGDPCGPGGCGSLSEEKYHKPYQQMTVGVIRGKQRELKIDDTKPMSAQDRERFIQSWRGASRQEDPGYYAAIDAAYKTN